MAFQGEWPLSMAFQGEGPLPTGWQLVPLKALDLISDCWLNRQDKPRTN